MGLLTNWQHGLGHDVKLISCGPIFLMFHHIDLCPLLPHNGSPVERVSAGLSTLSI